MKESDYTYIDEDFQLVSLCQKGDLVAFEKLVRKHDKRMLNIAYRMIGSYEEANEVVQDAFISAFKNINSFKGMSKFSTWCSSIVINLSRKRLKQLKTQHFHEPISASEPVKTGNDKRSSDPLSNQALPDEILEKREVQEKVQHCLSRLDVEFREIVILRDVHGFSYEEICAVLNIPQGTVKSRLFRGRALLKNYLKKLIGAI